MNPKHINNTNDTNAIVELADAELTEVSGGAEADYYLQIDGVKGESLRDKKSTTDLLPLLL